MGRCIGHEPCPKCGSRDNLARYEDGGAHCFSAGCGYFEKAGGTPMEHTEEAHEWAPIQGEYKALPARGLDEADFRHWGYQMGHHPKLGAVHIMNVKDATGKLVGQKYRTKAKDFSWLTDTKKHPLYGVWLWPSKGKSITITEGELDAISVSKSFGHRWPVVSLPDGTGSVRKALTNYYDWLDGFEKIVLAFDQDEHGQKAAAEAIELLPAGKVHIMRFPEGCKDANETLVKHGTAELSKCFWNATLWKPDGIVAGEDIDLDKIMQGTSAGIPMPYPKLQEMVFGFRPELTLITAGSGIGKSTLAREWAYYLRKEHDCRIGNIFLEEQNQKTAQAFVAIDHNIPLGRLRYQPDLLSRDEWAQSKRDIIDNGMFFYDHFGSIEGKSLISKIAYLRKVCGVQQVILDHVSITVSGLETQDERRDLDMLMTNLQTVIQQTGVGIIAISHLKRKMGVSFNEGGQISLNDLRGSAALEQLSDNVIALERDQQADGDKSCRATLRVLKCRETGYTGLADTLNYNRDTGRYEVAAPFADDPEEHKF